MPLNRGSLREPDAGLQRSDEQESLGIRLLVGDSGKERGGDYGAEERHSRLYREGCFTELGTLFWAFLLTMDAPCKTLCQEAQGKIKYIYFPGMRQFP